MAPAPRMIVAQKNEAKKYAKDKRKTMTPKDTEKNFENKNLRISKIQFEYFF